MLHRRFSNVIITSFVWKTNKITPTYLNQETQEFKELIKELFVLQGTVVIADYLPWLRPMDLGGTEKRMQQLRVRLDAFCAEIIEEHEVKRLKGPIAEQDKSMMALLLNQMHEQDDVDPIDLDNLRSTIMVRLIRISNTHEPSLLL